MHDGGLNVCATFYSTKYGNKQKFLCVCWDPGRCIIPGTQWPGRETIHSSPSSSAVRMDVAKPLPALCWVYTQRVVVDCVWNVMAHAQKPDFVFWRNGRVHLNRRGRQFCRLLAAEVCASAVVMLDTPCSEGVWRVLATHSIRQFPLHFLSRASPCAITSQLDSNSLPNLRNNLSASSSEGQEIRKENRDLIHIVVEAWKHACRSPPLAATLIHWGRGF
jgi:hypothetical protein